VIIGPGVGEPAKRGLPCWLSSHLSPARS